MLTEYDATAAIKACCVPIAYIGAAAPIGDVNRFRKICPNLITGQTIGSGPLSPLEVPDQINPMLERFVEVYAAKGEKQTVRITQGRDRKSMSVGAKPRRTKLAQHPLTGCCLTDFGSIVASQ